MATRPLTCIPSRHRWDDEDAIVTGAERLEGRYDGPGKNVPRRGAERRRLGDGLGSEWSSLAEGESSLGSVDAWVVFEG